MAPDSLQIFYPPTVFFALWMLNVGCEDTSVVVDTAYDGISKVVYLVYLREIVQGMILSKNASLASFPCSILG